MDTLLRWKRSKEKSPESGGIPNHGLKRFAPQLCTLLLCYSHCPMSKYHRYLLFGLLTTDVMVGQSSQD